MIDTEKIKQKILDLAIRGKLVPQDPRDGNAQDLINQIREEKARLVKEGKIKANKNESYIFKSSDNCYYEKIYKLNEVLDYIQPGPYIVSSTDYKDKGTPVLTANKGFVLGYTQEKKGIYNCENSAVIIFDDFTTDSKYVDFDFKVKSSALKILKNINESSFDTRYVYYAIKNINYSPSTHKRFWISVFSNFKIRIPSIWYQKIVVDVIDIINYFLDQIQQNQEELCSIKEQLKLKILDDIFDENSRYKSYYEKLYTLGDILPYEQPANYIVKSTEYSNDYATPVLTPGKTFILGYTNETNGIYDVKGSKVIIFDDFTTASRLVDFNFKVKSSAMKILHSVDEQRFNINYLFYLLQTIKVNNDTHKRFWISEYSPIVVRIHDYKEQQIIVDNINKAFSLVENIIQ